MGHTGDQLFGGICAPAFWHAIGASPEPLRCVSIAHHIVFSASLASCLICGHGGQGSPEHRVQIAFCLPVFQPLTRGPDFPRGVPRFLARISHPGLSWRSDSIRQKGLCASEKARQFAF